MKSLGGKTEEVKTAAVAAPTTPNTSDTQASLSEDEGNGGFLKEYNNLVIIY